MLVKDLIKTLQAFETPDQEILCSIDIEGNMYKEIYEVVWENSKVVIYPSDDCHEMDEEGNFIKN